jgi:hypothetical protein
MSASQGSRSEPQNDSYGRISIFLDQLIDILRLEELSGAMPSHAGGAGVAPAPVPTAEMARSAASHGRELHRLGFTIDEVVRNYGGMCQAITTLALELDAGMEVAEFRTLNRCLDEGIAQAVVAFTSPDLGAGDTTPGSQPKDAARLDGLASMFHYVGTATAAVQALRTGRVGLEGATGAVLDRSLKNLTRLIDDAVRQAA